MTKLLNTINKQTTANFKLYKAGKFLLTSSTAIGATVFLQEASQNTLVVHADQVSVSSSNVNSSTNIPIDHSGLNNAAQDARNNGVVVEQDATKTQTVSNSNSADAKQKIQTDEAQQQSQVQSVADQQKKNNQAYNDTKNAIAQQNSSSSSIVSDSNNRLTNSENAAKNAGVDVDSTSSDSQVNYTAVDNRNDQTLTDSVNKNIQANKDAATSAANSNNTQAGQLDQVTAKFLADKKQLADEQAQVSNQRSKYLDLINQAKNDGININNTQQTENDDFQSIMNAYSSAQQDVQSKIDQFNNAKTELANQQNSFNQTKQSVQNLIDKAKSLGVTVNISGQSNINDFDSANSQLNSQSSSVQDAISKYQAEVDEVNKENAVLMDQYNKAMDDFNAKFAASQGQPGSTKQQILQALYLGAEGNASLSIQDKNGVSFQSWAAPVLHGPLVTNANNQPVTWQAAYVNDGDVVTANYGNLTNSFYDQSAVKNIQRQITVHTDGKMLLYIPSDPSMGLWYIDEPAAGPAVANASIDIKDAMTDGNGQPVNLNGNAYMVAGSLNTWFATDLSNAHIEQASVDNSTFIPIEQSSVVMHSNGIAYSDENNTGPNYTFSNGATVSGNNWDDPANPYRFFGAGIFQVNSTNNILSYHSYLTDKTQNNGNWVTINTGELPVLQVPNKPVLKQVQPMTINLQDINYTRQVETPTIDQVNLDYNRTVTTPKISINQKHNPEQVPDSVKPENLKTFYSLTNLTATPAAPVKTATVNGQDANNRQITKGDTVQFTLSDDTLAAGRGDDVKSSYITDGLSKNLTFKDYHAYIGDEDVTSQVQMTNNNGVLTFTDGQSILDRYNKDKTNSQQTVRIVVDAVASADNATIDNTFQHFINGSTDTSNTITDIKTPGYNPTKEVLDNNDKDANNKNVEQGDSTKYLVNFDLSQVGLETLVSDDQVAKGLSITDNYDPNFVPNTSSAFVYSTQNRTNITDLFNFDWDTANHKVTITVKDPRSFLQTYGHQILPISLFGNVSGTATGDIKNTAIQNVFGQQYSTNTVTQHVVQSAPTKSVVAKTGDSTENQPKDIAINADFWYALTSSNRPSNIANDTKTWSLDDKFDKNHDLYLNNTQIYANQSFIDASGKTVAVGTNLNTYFGNDFSKYFNVSFDQQNNEIKVSATDAYLSLLNGSSNKNTNQQWTAYVNMKRIAAGTVNNVITENYNNRSNRSNVVTTSTNDKFEPAKRVLNGLGQDDNGQTIEQGDSIHYSMDWDLVNITKDTFASATQWAHGLNFFDNYDKQFVPNKSNVKITDSKLKDITSLFNITFDDKTHQMKITPKDQHEFIASEGGQKLLVELFGQAADDATGAISNTAVQDNFGDLHKTNTVTNNVSALQPKKSIEVNGTAAKPGEVPNIKLGQVFPYDLQSSTRAANLGEPTKQWSFEDKLDVEHDQYQNDGKVLSSTTFVDENGKTQPVGTDITKYFDIAYDDKTGDLKFTAKQSYLDLINSDANRKIQISWLARFDVKRIAAGDSITNVFTETYNNKVTKSNQVISKTDAPVIATQHAAEVMSQDGSVAAPVVQKQLASTSSRDQANNDVLDLILLSLVGATSSLVLLKKRN